MSDRWEYMIVSWVSRRIPVKHDFYIWRPGQAKAEIRHQWSEKDPEAEGPHSGDLLNELGAEGWELVSDVVTESAVGTTQSGWDRGGFPIKREWTLKRRVPAH